MKFLFKSLSYIIVFILFTILFLPKEQLYYFAEQKLQKHEVVISNEKIKEGLLTLSLKDANLYFEQMNISYIQNIDMKFYFFTTNIHAKNIRVSKSFENFLPSKIDFIDIDYSIIDFNNIKLKAKGDFGELEGELNILDGGFNAVLNPSSLFKSKYKAVLKNFRLVKGEYTYEYKL